MEPHRFPDDPTPRWYGTESNYPDAERDRAGTGDPRYAEDVFRAPEPRGSGRDRRYDGLTETHERSYGAPDHFGERDPLESTGPRRIDAGRTPLDAPLSSFEPNRSFGDPTVTAERSLAFDVAPPAPPSLPGVPPGAPPPAATAPPLPPPGMTGIGPRSGEPLPPPLDAPRQHAEPIDRAALRRGPAAAARVGEGFYRTRRPLIAVAFAVVVTVFEVPALRLLASAAFDDPISGTGIVSGILLVGGLPMFAMGLYSLVTGVGRPPGQAAVADWLRPPVAYLTIGLALLVAAALAAG
ncbi:MAG TPA: hypothetical protein VFR67_11080 [Pilimelia sp.]|nr:hypothetical protein [Pilimelia sp.]